MVVDDAATILAHRSRTGKRRGHFIKALPGDCRLTQPGGWAVACGLNGSSALIASSWGRRQEDDRSGGPRNEGLGAAPRRYPL